MLRAVLLASPLLLALASCGDSTSSFDDSALTGGTQATGANAGESTGASSNNGGDGSAGTNASGGSSSDGGKGNAGSEPAGAGTKNSGGAGSGSGGKGNTAGSAGDGGTNQAGTSGSGQGGSGGAQAGSGGSTAGDSGSSGSGGSAAGNSGTGGSSGMGGGGSSSGPTCPDVLGDYDIKNVEGAGCFGVDDKSTQSIQSTDRPCYVRFVSTAPSFGGPIPGSPAVNGEAALGENGDFTATPLTIGKQVRPGCTGNWDANGQRMTVKCGSAGQACSVTLERK